MAQIGRPHGYSPLSASLRHVLLARDAENRQDLRDAYQYNLDTLGMFTQLQDEQSPYADQERIRESIAALMDVTEIAGRYAEALEWANRYALFVPENSPDYAGLQFREAGLHRKMGDMARWQSLAPRHCGSGARFGIRQDGGFGIAHPGRGARSHPLYGELTPDGVCDTESDTRRLRVCSVLHRALRHASFQPTA